MISNEEIERINKGVMPLNVIWAAMLVSLFIYIVVGLYAKDFLRITMEMTVVDTLRNVLYLVSFVTLIATRFIRKLILSGKGRNLSAEADQSSYQGGQSGVLARYASAMIVSLAMTESIGIYGLVLFFLGKNEMDLYLFILVSAAAMLVYRPKRDEIVSLTEELNKQRAGDPLQRTR